MKTPQRYYFPAIVCSEHDSPLDALLALCVARDEVMDLVVAAWLSGADGGAGGESGGGIECIVAQADGGRDVAALRSPQGRWLACNAFLDSCCATLFDAERALSKRQKRGRRGCIGVLPALPDTDEKKPARQEPVS